MVLAWEYQPGTYAPILQTEREPIRDAPQDEIDQRFYSIITDLTGTPAELLAEDGTLAGRQQRTLWGATAWNSDGASTPLRFPGQYEDQETGLHYNNQRYYDPLTGSYLSPDPLGLEAGLNNHAYVANPYLLIDPLGLQGCGASEYTHVAVDKQGAGLDQVRLSLNAKGLQTAASRNIKLSDGSEKMGHHQHVFMWDASAKGIKGAAGIVKGVGQDSSVIVKIRSGNLKEPTWLSPGTLKGDRPMGLGGSSENGAWAYEGDIPRKYLFIDGIDQANQPGFEDWLAGKGWPSDHAALAERRYGYEELP